MSEKPIRAIHGGTFFNAIGQDLQDLSNINSVVSADVLDAWYDPSPRVITRIQEYLPWLVKTSPPTHADGLRRAISAARGVPQANIVLGSGTSSLQYLALPDLLRSADTMLILNPSYGEYAHIAENVIGCHVQSFPLPMESFRLNVADLSQQLQDSPHVRLVAIVNPNSPTGVAVPRIEIEGLVRVHPQITFWIDETYIDFYSLETQQNQSLENLVPSLPNLIVCKSMSKFYALSGLRIGYLVAKTDLATKWETHSPPWSIGLLAQLAGIEALGDDVYYTSKAAETRQIRESMKQSLISMGLQMSDSNANFLLLRLTERHLAAELIHFAAERNIFLRDCDSLSKRFNGKAVRVAVKSADTNRLILKAIEDYLV